MKMIKYISVGLMAAFMWASCSSDLREVKICQAAVPPVMANHDPVVITLDNMKEMTAFAWTNADFGYDAAIEYALYGRIGDGNASVISTSFTSPLEVMNEELNNWLLGAGALAGQPAIVTMYMLASISSAYEPVKSNEVEIEMTATSTEKVVYVPGNHQGWNPAAAPKLYDVNFTDTYEGMLALYPDAGTPAFKITPQPNWDVAWGGTLNNIAPGDNITELETGFYWMQFFRNASPMRASVIKLDRITVAGSAIVDGEWNANLDLVMDLDNRYIWRATANFQEGEIKFKFNGLWDTSIGGSMNNLRVGGGNVPFNFSGNRTLILDMTKYPFSARVE